MSILYKKRVFLISTLFLFYTLSIHAQRIEIGGGLAALTYTGDIIKNYNIEANRPGVTFFYRQNYNYAMSIRIGLTGAVLQANDAAYGSDIFSKNRDATLDIFLTEASLVTEYNFLDFKNPKARVVLSPYVFGGIAAAFLSPVDKPKAEFSPFQFTLPFGMGVKYKMNRHLYLAAEFGCRKTFTDYLDNVSAGNPAEKNYQYGNHNDTDYYYFTTLTLNYTIFRVNCPYDFY